jgi:sulfate transport system permease protein
MATDALVLRPANQLTARRLTPAWGAIGWGLGTLYLSVIVLLPLGALVSGSLGGGPAAFWKAISTPQALASLELTTASAGSVAVINAIAGTLLAWVLVRDQFRGKAVIDTLIDLPLALPTIVAGLTLLAIYGPHGPLGVSLAYTRASVVLALLFVTLPFVVRTVQPILIDLESRYEEAAATLGASQWTIFRRIVLPALVPGIMTGMALGFARCMGEFGAVVLLSGNVPFSTEVTSVYIYGLVESNAPNAAAAVSVTLMAVSLAVLLALFLVQRWFGRHES